MGDDAPSTRISRFSHGNWSAQYGVAADKRIITDDRSMFGNAVKVGRNRSSGNIDPLPNLGVSEVAKVPDMSTMTDTRVFYLDVVSYVDIAVDMGA